MVKSYTAKYTKIESGYMGQLIEWPEVVTEGDGIEECRSMLHDALREMVLAYWQQGKEIPLGACLAIFKHETAEIELKPDCSGLARTVSSLPHQVQGCHVVSQA